MLRSDRQPITPESDRILGRQANAGSSGSHRPQSLVLSFFASRGLVQLPPPVPSRILIGLLTELGVNEGATRRTLARMVTKGLLVREVSGRKAAFTLTEDSRLLLLSGRQRVNAPDPFEGRNGNWTLLAFSLPERHRDVRHQLRARLLWAGLGPLRDGLWIGPGIVDVDGLLSGLPLDGTGGNQPWAFTAQPIPPTQVDNLIRRVWDVEAVREAHQTFLRRWADPFTPSIGPMAALTLLIADWLRLLRSDPGLPKEHLGADWPASQSARTYHCGVKRLHPAADKEFATGLATSHPPVDINV